MNRTVKVQLLHVPDCPLVDRVRGTLDESLRELRPELRRQVEVEELEGAYPSPTLLVDGLDVTTGRPPHDVTCCRLDLPTSTQISRALGRPT